MGALIQAKERGDPAGWLAFQTRVSSLKLQRSRLEREGADMAGLLAEVAQRERAAGEFSEYQEAVGQWDEAQARRWVAAGRGRAGRGELGGAVLGGAFWVARRAHLPCHPGPMPQRRRRRGAARGRGCAARQHEGGAHHRF